jgi:hypothetical protein
MQRAVSSIDGHPYQPYNWKPETTNQIKPCTLCGTGKSEISLSPSLIEGRIVPQKVLFRSFLVSNQNDYTAMSGGLVRSSADAANFLISSQTGGFSKDAWIISPEPGRVINVLKETPESAVETYNDMLPSHAAENLFWVGRYTERILGNARFLRTVMQFLAEGNKLITDVNRQTETSLLEAFYKVQTTLYGFDGEMLMNYSPIHWGIKKDVLFNEKSGASV